MRGGPRGTASGFPTTKGPLHPPLIAAASRKIKIFWKYLSRNKPVCSTLFPLFFAQLWRLILAVWYQRRIFTPFARLGQLKIMSKSAWHNNHILSLLLFETQIHSYCVGYSKKMKLFYCSVLLYCKLKELWMNSAPILCISSSLRT